MSTGHSFHEAPLLFDSDEAPLAPLPGGKLPSYIADHRQRLRDRFMQGGAAAIPDYELLELVLFRSIPRRDVKPLARALLAKPSAISTGCSARRRTVCRRSTVSAMR